MHDEGKFLRRAVELAAESIDKGGGPFGAVITKDGNIIAEGANMVVLSNDPTAHAEVSVIRKASVKLNTFNLSDCTLYTSCEPCPMCLGAIYWAGIKRVIYSSDRNRAAKAGFNDRFIYDEMTLEPGARKIEFIRMADEKSEEVFRKWEQSGNKIPY
jgi:tRNA(Arg) A34 adenosine deaminase TadA